SDGFSGMSTSGITSANHDVKLTTGGDLTINQAVTLGTGNLTLSATGDVTQSARGGLAAAGLRLTGAGHAHLDNRPNAVTTLSTNFDDPISYTNPLPHAVPTVSDGFSGMSTSGITSTNHDVKLTTGGNLTINQAVTLGAGNLTLSVTGNVTQGASGVITADGLQMLGNGSDDLDNGADDVTKLAASFNGPISYTDRHPLTVTPVPYTTLFRSTSGITSTNHDVKLTTGGNLTIGQVITLGAGNLTLNVTGNVTQGASGVLT